MNNFVHGPFGVFNSALVAKEVNTRNIRGLFVTSPRMNVVSVREMPILRENNKKKALVPLRNFQVAAILIEKTNVESKYALINKI